MPKRYFQDRIVVYKDEGQYVAVSLEFDLFAEGDNPMITLKRLFDATIGYLKVCIEDNEPDMVIYRKAPKKYQDMFDKSQTLAKFLTGKQKKGILKRKEQNIIKKETHTMFKSYDSRQLVNA